MISHPPRDAVPCTPVADSGQIHRMPPPKRALGIVTTAALILVGGYQTYKAAKEALEAPDATSRMWELVIRMFADAPPYAWLLFLLGVATLITTLSDYWMQWLGFAENVPPARISELEREIARLKADSASRIRFEGVSQETAKDASGRVFHFYTYVGVHNVGNTILERLPCQGGAHPNGRRRPSA